METKHIFLEASGEHHSYLVAIPLSAENIGLLSRRSALSRDLKLRDADMADVAYSFYDFEVYDSVDPEDYDLDVSGTTPQDLPEGLPLAERIDFGQMVVDEKHFHIRFGIKHVHDVFETGRGLASR
jgi:hypothetical protein